MMKILRHTLVSDGPTDANLIPIINWTLKHAAGIQLPEGMRAEFWRLPEKPRNLAERLVKAVELFPCDLLCVHRDAEKELPQTRLDEIRLAFDEASVRLPVLAVVPVRMLEAWLCFDEGAIRQASGNPRGHSKLKLPKLRHAESHPNPKADLLEALLAASELSGRRRKKFDTSAAFWRIVDCIEDFSPLRELPSFQAFENSVRSFKKNNWQPGFYV
jgi:hypothetical protein